MSSIAEKLSEIAINQHRLFLAGFNKGCEAAQDIGFKKGYEAYGKEYWEAFCDRGGNFQYAFAYAHPDSFCPTCDIKPKLAGTMFMSFNSNPDGTPYVENYDMAEHLRSLGISLDFSGATGVKNVFQNAAITHLGVIDLSSASGTLTRTLNTAHLKVVDKLILTDKITAYSAIFNSMDLESVIVEGTIAGNGFSVSTSGKVSYESLMSIINALKDNSADTSGTVWKVTLGTTNLKKLTDAEKAIATEKGWTLA